METTKKIGQLVYNDDYLLARVECVVPRNFPSMRSEVLDLVKQVRNELREVIEDQNKNTYAVLRGDTSMVRVRVIKNNALEPGDIIIQAHPNDFNRACAAVDAQGKEVTP